MPIWVVPSDVHVPGDPGHTTDHNSVADDLTIISGLIPVTATPAAGDLIIQNATPAPARLAAGSANQVLGVSGGLPAWQPGLTLQVATASAGYTLVNGTGTIITWTTPNDGNVHHVHLYAYVYATSTMTAGQVNGVFTDPAGHANNVSLVAGGIATAGSAWNTWDVLVEANTAVTVSQGTALTGGAAKCWAAIWGC